MSLEGNQVGKLRLTSWLLGAATTVMAVGGLFVASRAGHGVGYYGGLVFFGFAVLFVMLLIKTHYDLGKEAPSLRQFRALFVTVSGFLIPAVPEVSPRRPTIRKIVAADLRDALARGFADFDAQPSHLIFLCLIYPVVSLILARLTFGYETLPLFFPLLAGFTLVGPLAATGLYELSRRREQGLDFSWWHVFDVLRSPSIRAIVTLGVVLAAIFVAWLAAAQAIFVLVFGNWVPTSIAEFALQVFTTSSGWTLIIVGCGVGFLFALVVFTISVVSIPLLLDRKVGAVTAIRTSAKAVLANPGTMTVWGLIVAGALVIGSLPLFVGLAVVLPVLGHATWHLYCKVVER